METILNWLLASSPWVEYRTRLDLLGQTEDDPKTVAARKRLLEHPLILRLVEDLQDWPGTRLISHKSAGHSIHKLVFLADVGLKVEDPGMRNLVEKIISHQEGNGPFQVLTNISTKYGGSGEDVWAWGLCDAPLIVYALVKFGLQENPAVKKAVNVLISLVKDNGWPCAGSTQYGTFRGPGRKNDPCPYANLIMLRLLAVLPDYNDSEPSRFGTESILHCWQNRVSFHPYIFYMGNDFCKLKAPLVWYDLMHVSFVLTQFRWLKGEDRLTEILKILANKADADGRYTSESIWNAWKDWDFGQKKAPSPWLTYLALKTLKEK